MEIRLHLDEAHVPATGRAAFSPPPQPLWAEHESDGLVTALRFHSRHGEPVLSELRVFPAEDDRFPGEWSDDAASVPLGGLNATQIHNTPIAKLRDAAIALMSDPNHPVWEQAGFERWEQWWDTVAAAGIEAERAQPKPRGGGRPPYPDRHFAEVALHYVTAARKGVRTHEYIRKQMAGHGKYPPIGAWVSEARKRGFLTPTTQQGRIGGTLTSKARAVLRNEGLLPSDPQVSENHIGTHWEGDTE